MCLETLTLESLYLLDVLRVCGWECMLDDCMIPSQQEKIYVHSFVLGPELRTESYTYVKHSEHHRF